MAKESFKVMLPGRIYQKNNRWWWNVKLAGERKAKPRALRPAGSRFATKDRDVAEGIAREMWELAIEAEAAARVKAEAAETIAKQRAEFEEKVRVYAEAAAIAEARAKTEVQERARAEVQIVAAEKARSEAEERARLEAQARADAEAKLIEILGNSIRAATCECCGKEDVPEKDLVRIDSGQLLCPDCLGALRERDLS